MEKGCSRGVDAAPLVPELQLANQHLNDFFV